MTDQKDFEEDMKRSQKILEEAGAFRAKMEELTVQLEAEAALDQDNIDEVVKSFRSAMVNDLTNHMREIDNAIEELKDEESRDDKQWEETESLPA